MLAAYPWVLNPDTLREVIDDPEELLAVRDRLTDKLEYAERDAVRARLLSLRAVVSRVLGDLDFALADGREAVRHAEATGELRRTAIAKARLAHVLRWRSEFAEADRLFEEANSVELPNRLRAEMYELAGRSAFDQGRYLEAMNRFEQALDLRKGEDQEMVARIESALDTVQAQMRKNGFGPYARSVDEILQRPTPQPLQDADRYAEVQPFARAGGLDPARRLAGLGADRRQRSVAGRPVLRISAGAAVLRGPVLGLARPGRRLLRDRPPEPADRAGRLRRRGPVPARAWRRCGAAAGVRSTGTGGSWCSRSTTGSPRRWSAGGRWTASPRRASRWSTRVTGWAWWTCPGSCWWRRCTRPW